MIVYHTKYIHAFVCSTRTLVEVGQLEKDKTHEIEQPLEDGAGTIKLLVTVTGTYGSEVSSDLANYTPHPLYRDKLLSKYVSLSKKLFRFAYLVFMYLSF